MDWRSQPCMPGEVRPMRRADLDACRAPLHAASSQVLLAQAGLEKAGGRLTRPTDRAMVARRTGWLPDAGVCRCAASPRIGWAEPREAQQGRGPSLGLPSSAPTMRAVHGLGFRQCVHRFVEPANQRPDGGFSAGQFMGRRGCGLSSAGLRHRHSLSCSSSVRPTGLRRSASAATRSVPSGRRHRAAAA